MVNDGQTLNDLTFSEIPPYYRPLLVITKTTRTKWLFAITAKSLRTVMSYRLVVRAKIVISSLALIRKRLFVYIYFLLQYTRTPTECGTRRNAERSKRKCSVFGSSVTLTDSQHGMPFKHPETRPSSYVELLRIFEEVERGHIHILCSSCLIGLIFSARRKRGKSVHVSPPCQDIE